MAGDWIKMRTDLYRDPKVIVMANLLGQPDSHLARHVNQFLQRDMSVTSNVTRCAVVGALVAVWGVARHQGHRCGDDLLIDGVNSIILDDISDMPGFGEVMTEAGWAVDTDAGVLFPKFFRENNVDPDEQKREKAANRKRRQRERDQRDNERDMKRDKSVTVTHREEREKRREENLDTPIGVSGPTSKTTQSRFTKPTLEQVREYCQSRKNSVDPQKFLDHYESNGWRVGKNPMKNWQASVRTWEQTQLGPAVKTTTSQKQFAGYNPDKAPAVTNDEVPF